MKFFPMTGKKNKNYKNINPHWKKFVKSYNKT